MPTNGNKRRKKTTGHRSAGIVPYNVTNRAVLMVLLKSGKWVVPSGKCDGDKETVKETAVREYTEETRCHLPPQGALVAHDMSWCRGVYYTYAVPDADMHLYEALKPTCQKVERAEWVTLDKLNGLLSLNMVRFDAKVLLEKVVKPALCTPVQKATLVLYHKGTNQVLLAIQQTKGPSRWLFAHGDIADKETPLHAAMRWHKAQVGSALPLYADMVSKYIEHDSADHGKVIMYEVRDEDMLKHTAEINPTSNDTMAAYWVSVDELHDSIYMDPVSASIVSDVVQPMMQRQKAKRVRDTAGDAGPSSTKRLCKAPADDAGPSSTKRRREAPADMTVSMLMYRHAPTGLQVLLGRTRDANGALCMLSPKRAHYTNVCDRDVFTTPTAVHLEANFLGEQKDPKHTALRAYIEKAPGALTADAIRCIQRTKTPSYVDYHHEGATRKGRCYLMYAYSDVGVVDTNAKDCQFVDQMQWYDIDRLPSPLAMHVHKVVTMERTYTEPATVNDILHGVNRAFDFTKHAAVMSERDTLKRHPLPMRAEDDPKWCVVRQDYDGSHMNDLVCPPYESVGTNASTGDGKSFQIQKFVRSMMRRHPKEYVVIHLVSYTAQAIGEEGNYHHPLPIEGDEYAPLPDVVLSKYEIAQRFNAWKRDNPDKEDIEYDGPSLALGKNGLITTYESLWRYAERIESWSKSKNIILIQDEVYTACGKYNSPTTSEHWFKGEQIYKKLLQTAVYHFFMSADIGVDVFDPKAKDPAHPELSPWDLACVNGGAVKKMLRGLAPDRKFTVHSYSDTKIKRSLVLRDQIDYMYWLNKACAASGNRLMINCSKATQCNKLKDIAIGMGKNVLCTVGGHRGDTHQKHAELANLNATMETKDTWLLTNAAAHGHDTNRTFLKQLLETSRWGADMPQIYQMLGRCDRHGNLIDTDVLVMLDKDTQHSAKSFYECLRDIRTGVADQRYTKHLLKQSGHGSWKPLQSMPSYAQEVIASMDMMKSRSEYEHETEFRRLAVFYHCTVRDERVDALKKKKDLFRANGQRKKAREVDELISRIYQNIKRMDVVEYARTPTSEYPDNQLPEIPINKTTIISAQYMSCAMFAALVHLTRDRKSDDDDDMEWDQYADESDELCPAMLSEFAGVPKHTIAFSEHPELREKCVAYLLPVVFKMLEEELVVGVKRKDQPPVLEELKKFRRRGDAIDAEHVIRALFQFCIKPDTRAAIGADATKTLFDLSTYIIVHSTPMLKHLTQTDAVQNLFADLRRYGRQNMLGCVIENAYQMKQFDVKMYHMTAEGMRFDPPQLLAYATFNQMMYGEKSALVQQLQLRARMTAFEGNRTWLDVFEAYRFIKMTSKGKGKKKATADGDDDVDKEDTRCMAADHSGIHAKLRTRALTYKDLCDYWGTSKAAKELGASAEDKKSLIDCTKGGPIHPDYQDLIKTVYGELSKDSSEYKTLLNMKRKLGVSFSGIKGRNLLKVAVGRLFATGMLRLKTVKKSCVLVPAPNADLGDMFKLLTPVCDRSGVCKLRSAANVAAFLRHEHDDYDTTPVRAVDSTKMSEVTARIDGLYKETTPMLVPNKDGKMRPNATQRRYEIIVVDEKNPLHHDFMVRVKHSESTEVVFSQGNVCVLGVKYTFKLAHEGQHFGRYYTGVGLQTAEGKVRRVVAWPSYICEIDQSVGHQRLGLCILQHFTKGASTPKTVSAIAMLERFVNSRDDLFIKPIVEAYGLLDHAGNDPKQAKKMGKELFLTLWMNGTIRSWCQKLAEGHLKRVLNVTTGESERIWAQLCKEWGGATDDKEKQTRIRQYMRMADGGNKRSADGAVKYNSTREAIMLQAISAAVHMYNTLGLTELTADVEDLLTDYNRAVRTTRDVLLAVPEHKIFTDVCKDKHGNWLQKANGRRKNEQSAFHMLLCHYEVPQMLFTVQFFETHGWHLDPLIHDGNLLRRKEFANTPEEAQTQLGAFLKTNMCERCDAYVEKMMLEHYGVPVRPLLAAKSLM